MNTDQARRYLPLAVMAAVAAIVGASSLLAHRPATSAAAEAAKSDSDAVKAAATAALIVHQQANAGSETVLAAEPKLRAVVGAAAPANGRSATPSSAPPSFDEEKNKGLKVGRAHQYFSGEAEQKELAAIDAVKAADSDATFKSLDGGVSSVTFKNVVRTGVRATADGTADAWATMAQQAPDGTWVAATARNTLVVHLELAQDADGAWKTSKLTWEFAPGSEP